MDESSDSGGVEGRDSVGGSEGSDSVGGSGGSDSVGGSEGSDSVGGSEGSDSGTRHDEGTDGPAGSASDGAAVAVADDAADGRADLSTSSLDASVIPAPVLVVDETGTIRDANDAFGDLLGYSASTLVGTALEDVCPDLTPSALADHCVDDVGALDARAVGPRGQTSVAFDVSAHEAEGGRRYVCLGREPAEADTDGRTLEQYERIIDTIDDGVYVLDDAFNITAVNDAVTELTGYSREELMGSNAAMLASEETLAQAATVTEALLSGESEAATISTTIETADGETVPIETRFSVYPFEDGSHGQVGVFRDISNRIWYERALATLNDATRELLGLDSEQEVCSLVVRTVTDVISLTAAVVYSFDSETNVLRPTATAAAGEDGAGPMRDMPVVSTTDSDVWGAFVDGERRVDASGPPVEIGGTAPVPAECAVSIPLGDYGVLVLAMDEGDRLDPNTMELIDLVAASAEAALDRVDRNRRLRERERELRDRNERLERLEGINEVIRRIDGALVGADSRSAIETAVCTHLAESPLFSLAWIGRSNGTDLAPVAWDGDDHHYLDGIDRSLAGGGGPPGVRTARSGTVTTVPQIADDLRTARWRTEAVSRGFVSALSIPLGPMDAERDGAETVLTVYADRTDAFRDQVRRALTDLGETISDALRCVDAAATATDHPDGVATSAVELDLRVHAPDSPLVRMARRTGCRLVHEGTVPLSDGRSLSVVRPEGSTRNALSTTDFQFAGIESVRDLDPDATTGRFGLEVIAPTVPSTALEAGARVRSLVIGEASVNATLAVPAGTGLETVRGLLDARFGPVTVDEERDAVDGPSVPAAFRSAAQSALTSRQWEVLRSAHLNGFFEWPRAMSGEEIAALLDVSQPTVSRHLRVGQGNLFDLLFDGDGG